MNAWASHITQVGNQLKASGSNATEQTFTVFNKTPTLLDFNSDHVFTLLVSTLS